MKECFLTWNGASFSAVTPGVTPPLSLFSRATPGPSISYRECPVPRALGVHCAQKLEWEDALLSSGRLALRSGLPLGGQVEEQNDREAVALGEGDEGQLHGWKQRS